MPSRFLLAAILLGASCTAFAQTLSPDGYGKVRFGDRLATAEKRVGQRATPRPRTSECAIVRFKRYPRVSFMVEQGRIVRADAKTIVRNSAGVTSAMQVEEVLRHHPHARVEPHKYEADGKYIILRKGTSKALIFETSKNKPKRVRAGLKPAVDYVEGCS
ncbi:hypothetical protein [Massilia sp. DD77]|uniref:hypothetical protein n=1 Tax=Massilia sp. DD77 TaxID=3109349 RepID=UPI002FFDB2DC